MYVGVRQVEASQQPDNGWIIFGSIFPIAREPIWVLLLQRSCKPGQKRPHAEDMHLHVAEYTALTEVDGTKYQKGSN